MCSTNSAVRGGCHRLRPKPKREKAIALAIVSCLREYRRTETSALQARADHGSRHVPLTRDNFNIGNGSYRTARACQRHPRTRVRVSAEGRWLHTERAFSQEPLTTPRRLGYRPSACLTFEGWRKTPRKTPGKSRQLRSADPWAGRRKRSSWAPVASKVRVSPRG
jgi:hypothetical protein